MFRTRRPLFKEGVLQERQKRLSFRDEVNHDRILLFHFHPDRQSNGASRESVRNHAKEIEQGGGTELFLIIILSCGVSCIRFGGFELFLIDVAIASRRLFEGFVIAG